jgi:hypothetical protein
MEFRIADTFADSLARLTADEQKAVRTSAFDLQVFGVQRAATKRSVGEGPGRRGENGRRLAEGAGRRGGAAARDRRVRALGRRARLRATPSRRPACRSGSSTIETASGEVSIGTMHLAKGLEFRAVAVMACDDEVIPLQARIEIVGDDADLQEVYETERHLLYVAATRARDRLLIAGRRASVGVPGRSRRVAGEVARCHAGCPHSAFFQPFLSRQCMVPCSRWEAFWTPESGWRKVVLAHPKD